MDLGATSPVTAVELALYKLPSGRDTKTYYVFVQYGTKMSSLQVQGSALGWQVAALPVATTETTNGELDVLVAVYMGGSGFLSCTAIKSLFAVAGNGEYSPVLAVYTNASNNNNNNSTNSSNSSDGGGALVYDAQGENQNHSYIALVSSARSECATKPTKTCYLNVNFSFKTSNKGRNKFSV